MATATAAQVAQWARSAGFQGDNLEKAVAVAYGESSLRTDARNSFGAGHYGLWQISALHFDPDKVDWKDGAVNAKLAKDVHEKQGWQAWTVYSTGKYLIYMNKAKAAVKDAGVDPGSERATTPTTDLGGLEMFFKAETWQRVALMLAGGLALTIAAFMFMKNSGPGKAISTVGKVVTKGVTT